MTEYLTVRKDGKRIYDIAFSSSFQELPAELTDFSIEKKRLCIVTDSNVEGLYLDELKQVLEGRAKRVCSFVFPAGEEYKTLDTVRKLYTYLIQENFDRKDMLIALGGGVVGDLTGFCAATYLRGIDFIQLPTTLLSQVDSSIGGKTGVDFDSYKNMVGAFYQPRLVYMNLSVLKTLPKRQFSSGMAEIIKHGLILDSDYFEWLWYAQKEIESLSFSALQEMIQKSCQIKRDVVEEDPTEQGIRSLLNFGHTLGHAIEKTMNFSLFHGECVAIGMVAAASISRQRGLISQQDEEYIRKVLKAYHLPCQCPDINKEAVLEAAGHDKKMESGVLKFILLKQLGAAYVDRTVTLKEIEEALEEIKKP